MAFPPNEKHASGDLVNEGKLLLFLQTEVSTRVTLCAARLSASKRRQANVAPRAKRKRREKREKGEKDGREG